MIYPIVSELTPPWTLSKTSIINRAQIYLQFFPYPIPPRTGGMWVWSHTGEVTSSFYTISVLSFFFPSLPHSLLPPSLSSSLSPFSFSFPLLWLWITCFSLLSVFFLNFLSHWLDFMFSISRTSPCLPNSKLHTKASREASLPPSSLQPIPAQGREPTWSSASPFLFLSVVLSIPSVCIFLIFSSHVNRGPLGRLFCIRFLHS